MIIQELDVKKLIEIGKMSDEANCNYVVFNIADAGMLLLLK